MNRQNVAIFVDYDNVYIALNQYYRDFTRPLLPYAAIQKIYDSFRISEHYKNKFKKLREKYK